jgi:hypothetical protein
MDVCREFDLTLEALRSVSRKRSLATARGVIAARAVDDARIATLSEVARFLHRSVAALSRSAERNRFR